jgi:hypothetical protein
LNDYNSSAREKWVQILDDLDAGIIFQQGDTILVRLKMDSIY